MQNRTATQVSTKSSCRHLQTARLGESVKHKNLVEEMLTGCFVTQNTYGKDPESLDATLSMMLGILADYPAEKVIAAVKTWMLTESQFPTPAGLVSLIKNGGKKPVSEAMYIAAQKVQPEFRTDEHWETIKRYEQALLDDHGWEKDEAHNLLEENRKLKAELERCKRALEAVEPAAVPLPFKREGTIALEERVRRTILHLKRSGASDADIQELLASVATHEEA